MNITVPNKVELKEIVLKIDEKELKLSLEEARDLKNILKDVLGDDDGQKIVYVPTWHYYYSPYPYYTYKYPDWPGIAYTTGTSWSLTSSGSNLYVTNNSTSGQY